MVTINDRGHRLLRVESGTSVTVDDGEFAICTIVSTTNATFSALGFTNSDANRGLDQPFYRKGTSSTPLTTTNCSVVVLVYEDPS